MARKAKRKPFVYYTTIWKSVGGGLSNPGESKVCKVKAFLTAYFVNRD